MIVTADAHGDYNATSQILRYSALAREVTVPRIPSITETILQANTAPANPSGPSSCASSSPIMSPTHVLQRPPFLPPGNTARSPNAQRSFSPTSAIWDGRVTMEHAALEIARLSDEARYLQASLKYEQEARAETEAHLLSMEDKMLDLEQAIREDCVAEFEQRLAVELARWKAAMQMAIERGEEHWDRKMDVFERSLALQATISEAGDGSGTVTVDDKENVLIESLEEENARLRRELAILKRELAGRTPSKRAPLMEREDFTMSANGSPRSGRSRHTSRNIHDAKIQGEILHQRIGSLTLRADSKGQKSPRHGSGSENSSRATSKNRADGSPLKKVRQLTPRKWEGDLDGQGDPF